ELKVQPLLVQAYSCRFFLEVDGPRAVPIGPSLRAGKPDQQPALVQELRIDAFARFVEPNSCSSGACEMSRSTQPIIRQVRKKADLVTCAMEERGRTQFRLHAGKRCIGPFLS